MALAVTRRGLTVGGHAAARSAKPRPRVNSGWKECHLSCDRRSAQNARRCGIFRRVRRRAFGRSLLLTLVEYESRLPELARLGSSGAAALAVRAARIRSARFCVLASSAQRQFSVELCWRSRRGSRRPPRAGELAREAPLRGGCNGRRR